jgi:hypothetical protein
MGWDVGMTRSGRIAVLWAMIAALCALCVLATAPWVVVGVTSGTTAVLAGLAGCVAGVVAWNINATARRLHRLLKLLPDTSWMSVVAAGMGLALSELVDAAIGAAILGAIGGSIVTGLVRWARA